MSPWFSSVSDVSEISLGLVDGVVGVGHNAVTCLSKLRWGHILSPPGRISLLNGLLARRIRLCLKRESVNRYETNGLIVSPLLICHRLRRLVRWSHRPQFLDATYMANGTSLVYRGVVFSSTLRLGGYAWCQSLRLENVDHCFNTRCVVLRTIISAPVSKPVLVCPYSKPLYDIRAGNSDQSRARNAKPDRVIQPISSSSKDDRSIAGALQGFKELLRA